jgi:hypothetical protein
MDVEVETETQCEWCNRLRWREDLERHGEEFFCKDSICWERFVEDKAARFDILRRDHKHVLDSVRSVLRDLNGNNHDPQFLVGLARGRLQAMLQEAERG